MIFETPFDKLFAQNIPHVLNSIFFELNPIEFERCRLVCKRWKDYIDCSIMLNETTRKMVEQKRLVHLWREERFAEQRLELKGTSMKWSEVDIESVSVKGQDIFVASENTVMYFKHFKLRNRFDLPENDKVRRMLVGSEVIMIISKVGNRLLVLNRANLKLLNTLKHSEPADKVPFQNSFGEKATFRNVNGSIYIVQKEKNLDINIYNIDASGEAILKTNIPSSAFPHEIIENDTLTNSPTGLDETHAVVAHPNGCLQLFDLANGEETLSYNFSEFTTDNMVRNVILTKNFCGVIFTQVFAGRTEDKVNFKLIDRRSGRPLAREMDISAYGRVYFSASDIHFIFSFADALHNQHFIMHKFESKANIRRCFVLNDRPQPMRSMQIVKEKILILSFYRTASALNIFDLENLLHSSYIMEELEIVKKLPQGVIAYQSSHNTANGQNLILYKESGVLCQRLDYSCDNVVFFLKFCHSSAKNGEAPRKIIQQSSGLEPFPIRFFRMRRKLPIPS